VKEQLAVGLPEPEATEGDCQHTETCKEGRHFES
jgi:hypothetical protein